MSETGKGALAVRGARTFKIGDIDGGDIEFTVFFSLNAQAKLEAELDKPVHEILQELEYSTFNATTTRAVLWAGMHGSEITLEEAGKYAISQREVLHLATALAQSQVPHEEIEALADKIDEANEAARAKANEALDEATEELRRPPTKKRGGKGGKRTRG